MNGSTPDHDDGTAGGVAGDGLTMRHVWIAGAVGAVLLVVLLAVAVAVTSGDGGGPDGRAAVAPSPTTTPTSPATSARPSASASSVPPTAPVVRWRGTVRLTDASSGRDLDTVPPRGTDGDRADIRGTWLHPGVGTDTGVNVAEMEPGKRPGARACRDAVSAAGVEEVKPLESGDVLCVVTGDGRVARLTVTAAQQVQSQPSLTLDAVLWDGG